jgi:hypothetical protein
MIFLEVNAAPVFVIYLNLTDVLLGKLYAQNQHGAISVVKHVKQLLIVLIACQYKPVQRQTNLVLEIVVMMFHP